MRQQLDSWAVPVFFWLLGLFFLFHPTFLSGFSRIQTDAGDTRLINYTLEQSFQWMTGHALFKNIWNPPFYFPAETVTAYTDTLFSAAPFYCVWRLLQFQPDTSFQLWALSMASLNFFGMHAFLRRHFKIGVLPSAVGAFLFAYGNARASFLSSPQLLPHFWSILSLHGLMLTNERRPLSVRSFQTWSPAFFFFLGFVGQFYASYYLAWFLAFALLLTLPVFCLTKEGRAFLIDWFSKWGSTWILGGLAAFLALSPLLTKYLLVASQTGYRPFEEIAHGMPRFLSWFHAGNHNWIFEHASRPTEKGLGSGILTSCMALAGLWYGRKHGEKLLLGVWILTIVFFTRWSDPFLIWETICHWIPGASAIRALSRSAVVLLIPISIGAAIGLEFLIKRRLRAALIFLLPLMLLEQAQTTPSYDKEAVRSDVRRIVEKIPPDCASFFYTIEISELDFQAHSRLFHTLPNFKFQLDAMWASLQRGVPTMNGFSGNTPPGWELGFISHWNKDMELIIADNLTKWIKAHRDVVGKVCWIKGAYADSKSNKTRPPSSTDAGPSASAKKAS